MNRREALHTIAAGLAAAAIGNRHTAYGAAQTKKKRLGIDRFSYNVRGGAERSGAVPALIRDPFDFLKHSHSIVAGGIQDDIGSRDEAYTSQMRRYAEEHDLFIEGSTYLPRDASDLERFESHVRTAKAAGAKVVRIAIGGRRYEQFDKAQQFRDFAQRSLKSIQSAEPVAARHGIKLAIENNKDFRVPEMLSMLERLSSQYVGVCVDTGNSFALLEDTMEVVRAYAAFTMSVHLKDMAVCEYEEGFLLAEVPMGEGLLDLPEIVRILREARPDIQFCVEMSTRDPLKVPCLTEKYWATFEEVRGADFARALRYVRTHSKDETLLPKVSPLPIGEQVELEEANIKTCLRYASERLNL
jgi:sugar phosphate isomerase/epimerase